jgi:SHS2 domain-containing protein
LAGDYELFDHTADLGIRLFAPTLPDLVRAAGAGLYGAIGELVPAGSGGREERFEFSGGDLPELLRDCLAELLLVFERDHRIVVGLEVERFEAGRLTVRGESRPLDRDRSLLDREVKAVTYHGLFVTRVDDGYRAEFIVDI